MPKVTRPDWVEDKTFTHPVIDTRATSDTNHDLVTTRDGPRRACHRRDGSLIKEITP